MHKVANQALSRISPQRLFLDMARVSPATVLLAVSAQATHSHISRH